MGEGPHDRVGPSAQIGQGEVGDGLAGQRGRGRQKDRRGGSDVGHSSILQQRESFPPTLPSFRQASGACFWVSVRLKVWLVGVS